MSDTITDSMGSGEGASPFLGRTFAGRCRIERQLGVGGMGAVFLARDANVGRPLVVKVPHAALLVEPTFRERFAREIQSLVAVEHRSVVSVLDVGEEDDTPFVVLQYLSGGSLKDRVQEAGGRQTPDEVSRWLPTAARALDSIHAEGLLHRDIKPANILFDRHGDVFLADFGIAKVLGATASRLTTTGAVPGTPEYMGPEVMTDKALGPRYDQYALAATVYEALAGALPQSAHTPLALLASKATKPPRPLGEAAPHVPAPVADAVMRALATEPADRFGSCGEFTEALAEALRAPPTRHCSLPPRSPATGLPVDARNPQRSRSRAVLLLVVLVGAGGTWYALTRGSDLGNGVPAANQTPRLALVRTAPTSVEIGEELLVRYLLRNDGSAPTGPVNLAEDLPDGLATTDGAKAVHLGTHALDAGEERELTARLEPSKIGMFSLKARANAAGLSAESETAVLEVRGKPKPRLAFSRSAPPAVSFGEEFAIEYTVKNDGTTPLEGVEITEALPEGLITLTGETMVRIGIGSLEVGAERTGTARCRAHKGGTYVMQASATAEGSTTKNDESSLRVRHAKLTLALRGPKTAAEGVPAEYTATVGNAGDAEAMGAALEVTLPEGAEPAPDAGGERAGYLVTWKLDPLPGGARRHVTFALQLAEPATIVASCRASGSNTARASWRTEVEPAVKLPGAEVLQARPDPSVITDPQIRARIEATDWPWLIRDKQSGIEFVLIPPGTFQMGAAPDDDHAEDNEEPSHEVTIKEAFYLARTEVTQEQWKRVEGDEPSHFKGAALPAEQVAWVDCESFCKELNRGIGRSYYRLPTEAEWEYACRARTTTQYWSGARAADLAKVGWCRGGGDETREVGLKPANAFGLHDVHGNVWEWCRDLYASGYYAESPGRDPQGPDSGHNHRVVRGGSYSSDAKSARATFRKANLPSVRARDVGFRPVRSTIDPPATATDATDREKEKQTRVLDRQAELLGKLEKWTNAASTYGEQARLYGELGKKEEQVRAFFHRHHCFRQLKNFSEAAAACAEMARLQREMGNEVGLASAIDLQAFCRMDAEDWTAAATLLAESASLSGRLGRKAEQAGSLFLHAHCLFESTQWSASARAFSDTARLKGELGDRADQAESLMLQANCLEKLVSWFTHGSHEAHTRDARRLADAAGLYSEASRLLGEIGEKTKEAEAKKLAAECLRKEKTKLADAHLGAREFVEAARLYGEGGNKERQALALFKHAFGNRDQREAARAFAEAARLHGELGDKSSQARALGYHAGALKILRRYAEAARVYGEQARLYGELRNPEAQAEALKLKRGCLDMAGK